MCKHFFHPFITWWAFSLSLVVGLDEQLVGDVIKEVQMVLWHTGFISFRWSVIIRSYDSSGFVYGFFVFMESHYLGQAVLQLCILLPQVPKCWDSRCDSHSRHSFLYFWS